MLEHRPGQLELERRDMLKASFDRMFGHNAKRVLDVIEDETARYLIEQAPPAAPTNEELGFADADQVSAGQHLDDLGN